MFKKLIRIIFIFFIANVIFLPVKAQVLDLSSGRNNLYSASKLAEVYKPSKLIIGEETSFVVKAEPGTYVTLLFSTEDEGADPINGESLRLGDIIDKLDGIVSEKGVVELKLKTPEKKDLHGKIVYFEALTWTEEDYSDLTRAKIMGINGRETCNNAVVMAKPITGVSRPSFGPSVPGMGSVSETIHALSEEADDKNEYLKEQMYFKNRDIMHRNLYAPELQEEQNEDEEN